MIGAKEMFIEHQELGFSMLEDENLIEKYRRKCVDEINAERRRKEELKQIGIEISNKYSLSYPLSSYQVGQMLLLTKQYQPEYFFLDKDGSHISTSKKSKTGFIKVDQQKIQNPFL